MAFAIDASANTLPLSRIHVSRPYQSITTLPELPLFIASKPEM
jgi:hypothetical protein